MKKARKQRSVLKEKITEIFINGEDTVSVLDVNQFKKTWKVERSIEYLLPQVGTETAVAAKRNELEVFRSVDSHT